MENTEIKIEKNVPIPKTRSRKKTSPYPFWKMLVGDSFFVEMPHDVKNQNKIGMAGWRFRKQNELENWKFSVRKVKNGYRVWRLK